MGLVFVCFVVASWLLACSVGGFGLVYSILWFCGFVFVCSCCCFMGFVGCSFGSLSCWCVVLCLIWFAVFDWYVWLVYLFCCFAYFAMGCFAPPLVVKF